jgi:hypothetical protein
VKFREASLRAATRASPAVSRPRTLATGRHEPWPTRRDYAPGPSRLSARATPPDGRRHLRGTPSLTRTLHALPTNRRHTDKGGECEHTSSFRNVGWSATRHPSDGTAAVHGLRESDERYAGTTGARGSPIHSWACPRAALRRGQGSHLAEHRLLGVGTRPSPGAPPALSRKGRSDEFPHRPSLLAPAGQAGATAESLAYGHSGQVAMSLCGPTALPRMSVAVAVAVSLKTTRLGLVVGLPLASLASDGVYVPS